MKNIWWQNADDFQFAELCADTKKKGLTYLLLTLYMQMTDKFVKNLHVLMTNDI